MQLRISPSMRSITISSNNGFMDSMKVRVKPRHVRYRTLFHAVLALAILLPFIFILTAFLTLEGIERCSSLGCLGRRLGPRFLVRNHSDSTRVIRELYELLNQVNDEGIPAEMKLPENFTELLSGVKNNQYDARTFVTMVKAMMERMEKEVKLSRLAEQLHKHFAASTVPKGIHCLSMCLTDEYSSNAHARKQLPAPELLHLISDNSYQHIILASDNILAASVVVTSVLRSSFKPAKLVFHLITDKKTYPGMHAWFALNSISPAVIEVKGVHQFSWLTRDNVPVLEAVESHYAIRKHYHGDHAFGTNTSDNPRVFASKLQTRSPKYISLLNHLRVYLPELFPSLNKVVFLDDDVVIQRDLSPLWEINLEGKVNGAVETCRGKDKLVMSKHFSTYFNFSHPIIAKNLNPNECAWAYGMNVFDLNAWRKTNIRETYGYWIKEYLKSNLTLWKFGTLPPALIAFKGHVHPIDSSWHMLGLGYQENTDIDSVKKASVIHYNGQCKPWLDIGFKHLQPFWTKYVDYSNDFIRSCHILNPLRIR